MRAGIAMGAICTVLLLASCGAHTRRDWLTFFFDGVPPEKAEGQAVAGQSPVAPGSQTGPPTDNLAAKAVPDRAVHKPYGDRKCDACHESQYSQKLRGEVDEICLLCHKKLFDGKAYRHAPAEAGYCLGCHEPHESTGKFLLVRNGQRLCSDCHDEKDVGGAAAHARMGDTACQACHDPHGGVNRLYLKPKAPKAPAEPAAPPRP